MFIFSQACLFVENPVHFCTYSSNIHKSTLTITAYYYLLYQTPFGLPFEITAMNLLMRPFDFYLYNAL